MECSMAIWLTVGFFEVQRARVVVSGLAYENSFQCIPSSLPVPPSPGSGAFLAPRTPLGVAIPTGPLLNRLQVAMKQRELLPYIEVRPATGKTSDVLRLNRVRVTGITPMTAHQTCHVTIVAEM
jgi:hypothetical protein